MTSNEATDSAGKDEEEKTRIEEFLQKQDAPYSERKLIEELFSIRITEQDLPKSQEDLGKLIRIRHALKKLVEEKRIFATNLEDPNTKESVLHYSAKGWYATP
jgi:NurA-like 5'-3' nuclease